MEKSTFKVVVSLLLLNEQNKVFLVRNHGTERDINSYGVVSTYLSDDISVFSSVIDVAEKRLDISLNEKDLSVALCMQLKREETSEIVFFVLTKKYKGSIVPDTNLYDDSMWAGMELLPLNTSDYIKKAIQCYRKGITFTVFP